MAIRWLYETTTGVNFCISMTSDDANVAIPENDNLPDTFVYAWTAPDPALESPAMQDLQPRKRYNIAQNRIYECSAAENAALNLRIAKAAKNEAIDKKTMRLFAKGFTFSAEVFPLEVDDFINYLERYANRATLVVYPLLVAKRNRDSFSISSATQMKNFGEAAFARRDSIVNGAAALKKQIFEAMTVAEVIAITDART